MLAVASKIASESVAFAVEYVVLIASVIAFALPERASFSIALSLILSLYAITSLLPG